MTLSYNRLSVSNKKEQTTNLHNSREKSQRHYVGSQGGGSHTQKTTYYRIPLTWDRHKSCGDRDQNSGWLWGGDGEGAWGTPRGVGNALHLEEGEGYTWMDTSVQTHQVVRSRSVHFTEGKWFPDVKKTTYTHAIYSDFWSCRNKSKGVILEHSQKSA